MKRHKIIVLAVVAALMLMAGNAWAGTDTSAVPVSAYVGGSCTLTGGAIDFGNIEVANQAALFITQPSLNCSSGMGYLISDDKGGSGGTLTSVLTGLGVDIDYTVSYTETGTGTGLAVNMGIASADIVGDFTGNTAGAYTDSITFTVTY